MVVSCLFFRGFLYFVCFDGKLLPHNRSITDELGLDLISSDFLSANESSQHVKTDFIFYF